MRADRVEVAWDGDKKSWLLRIINGEEVIRRHEKLPQDANQQTLRSAVEQALKDEGFEPDPIDIDIHPR
jgi:hypothetical protein